MERLMAIAEALSQGSVPTIREQVQLALDEDGMAPRQILEEGLLKTMEEIGRQFSANEIFVPEVLISARAMNAAMEVLKPRLVETGVDPVGRVVLGTVKGDLHDIGKNLVRMMLEGAGFEVTDLGVDVAPEDFVAAVRAHKPHLIGLSALLTTTMGQMRSVVEAVEQAGLRDQVIIMVGGAPVSDAFAEEIGADFYSKDAAQAATSARQRVLSA